MPTSRVKKAGRRAFDIAEIDNQHAGQPSNNEGETGLPLPENETFRRCAEAALAATTFIFLALVIIPSNVKKGQFWYDLSQGLVLVSTAVSSFCVFYGNTHIKLLKFLAVNGVFWQVIVLAVGCWAQETRWSDGYGLSASTTLLLRLCF